MASSGKKKTTMAKLMRESRLRERRQEKAARKVRRKEAAALGPQPLTDEDGFAIGGVDEDGLPTTDADGVPSTDESRLSPSA
jgi:hypothetical protein